MISTASPSRPAPRTRRIEWSSVPSPAPTRILTALKSPRARKPCSSPRSDRPAPSRGRVRRHAFVPPAAEQAPDRTQRFARMSQRHVDAADRGYRQAAPAEHGKAWPRASAAARLPLYMTSHRRAMSRTSWPMMSAPAPARCRCKSAAFVPALPTAAFVLAIADRAALGLDLHQGSNCRTVDAAEVGRVLLVHGLHMQPGRSNRTYPSSASLPLFLCPPHPQRRLRSLAMRS